MQSAPRSSHTAHDRMRVFLEEKARSLKKAAVSSFTYGHEDGDEDDEDEDEDEIQVETYNNDKSAQQAREHGHGTVQDITADMVKTDGKDLQGIPWERLHFSRTHYRTMRLRSYRNYVNVLAEDANDWRDEIKKKAHPKVKSVGGRFAGYFSFRRNHRVVNHSIIHFQLRTLVWAPTHNDVYTIYENCLQHYSPPLAPPRRSSFLPRARA